MASNAARLSELGMVPSLAREVANIINANGIGSLTSAIITAAGGDAVARAGVAAIGLMSIGLASAAAGAAIPDSTNLVLSTGSVVQGKGSARFAVSPDQASPAIPYLRFQASPNPPAASGRWFDIAEPTIHASMIGVKDDALTGSAAANAVAIQAGINFIGDRVDAGLIGGATLSFEGMRTTYSGQLVPRSGVLMYGGRNVGRGSEFGNCRLRPFGVTDGDYFIKCLGVAEVKGFALSGFNFRGITTNTVGCLYLDNAKGCAISHNVFDEWGGRCIVQTANTGTITHFQNFAQGLLKSDVVDRLSGSVEIAGGDFFIDGCEYSGPGQNSVKSTSIFCAAVLCTGFDGTFLNCVMQTGDAGLSGFGTRVRYVACRFDTNAGHGVYGHSGSGASFAGCHFLRNNYPDTVQTAPLYDHINIPAGGAAASIFTSPIFSNGSAVGGITRRVRFNISDAQASTANYNQYLSPTGVAGLSGFYNLTGVYAVSIANNRPFNLPAGATPSVLNATALVLNNASATTITDFLDGFDGQRITLFPGTANNTIANGAAIRLTANTGTLTPTSPVEFLRRTGVWWQV